MKALKRKILEANQWLKHGQRKMLADKYKVDYSRAKGITIGRCAPRETEMDFVRALVTAAKENQSKINF